MLVYIPIRSISHLGQLLYISLGWTVHSAIHLLLYATQLPLFLLCRSLGGAHRAVQQLCTRMVGAGEPVLLSCFRGSSVCDFVPPLFTLDLHSPDRQFLGVGMPAVTWLRGA